jgi:hypothetical protein
MRIPVRIYPAGNKDGKNAPANVRGILAGGFFLLHGNGYGELFPDEKFPIAISTPYPCFFGIIYISRNGS